MAEPGMATRYFPASATERLAMHVPSRPRAALAAVILWAGAVHATAPDPALATAVASPARPASAMARDKIRHPLEELSFFGLEPHQTVVELWPISLAFPGGKPAGGYWTDILAPYLAPHGHYYVALVAGDDGVLEHSVQYWHEIYDGKPAYANIVVTGLGAGHFDIAPPASADRVLTFRNLHNWMNAGYAQEALEACFRALKPGGILGMEEHRGRTDRPQDPKAQDGYVRQDYAIELAKKVGFEFAGSSEINANPRDTKDWEQGVWTLPPMLVLGDKDRERYLAVGEADNFVLKFRKPQR
jgi:predicted methyltransferase